MSPRLEPLHPRLLEWTGERCVPWATDHEMLYEHMHRYHFAAAFCAGKRVLDLASGEGYGSAILGAVASEVVGVDVDRASVEHARLAYGTDHVRFLAGSMLDRDLLNDHSFDVVVCLEALEHVGDHELLMQVIVGALRPKGLLVMSTPDRTIYTDLHEQSNPFHIHELDRHELRELLRGYFRNAQLLTQEVATGSVMQALDGGQGGELLRLSGNDEWRLQPTGASPYLVALASDAPLPPIPSVSTLVDTDVLLARRPPALTQLEESLATLTSDVVERNAEVARLTTAVATGQAEIENLLRTATERDSDLGHLEALASRQDAQIERLEGSIRTLAHEIHIAETAHAEAVAQLKAAETAHEATVAELTWEVGSIKATKGWRGLERMRRRYRQVRRLGRPLRRLPLFHRAPR